MTESAPPPEPVYQPPKKKVSTVMDLVQTLFSSRDGSSRFWSFVFFMSLIGACVSITLGGMHVYRTVKERNHVAVDQQAENIAAFYKAQKDAAITRGVMLEMGSFVFALKADPQARKQRPNELNVADLTITLECETAEGCALIEANLVKTRDRISGSFRPQSRAELMSPDGKNQLKSQILSTLNGWLPESKVRNVYITKLIIG